MQRIITTNCFIYKDGKILLGMKKRGFGMGRWNGFGGKLTEGETLERSAKREIKEEVGLDVSELIEAGQIEFEYLGKDQIVEVHFYKILDFSGEPTESEEMKPKWFEVDSLPFVDMWPDDRYWMPMFLSGEKFKGKFKFEGYDNILEYSFD